MMKIEFSGSYAEIREEMENFLAEGGESAGTSKPAAKKPAAKKPAAKDEPADDDEITIDILRETAAAAKERTSESIAPILAKFKASKLSEVKPADYAKLKAALEAMESDGLD